MRRRLMVVLSGLMLATGYQGWLQAQAALPQTYSFTLDPALSILGPGVTIKVTRDGTKELIEQTGAASAALPKGDHLRILYDFGLHRMYSVHESDPCGVSTTQDTKVQLDFDVISSGEEFLAQIIQAGTKPSSVTNDTAAGIPAKLMEYAIPQVGKARVWVAASGGYPLKVVSIAADGKQQTLMEMKQLSFGKPPASAFAVPAGCGAPTGTYTSANGVSSGSGSAPAQPSGPGTNGGANLARITAVKLQASLTQYTGPCAPGRMQLVGTITANGPGTAWYRFKFVDVTFPQGQEGTITFARAGTQAVTKDVTFAYDPGTRVGNAGGYLAVAMQVSADIHGPESNSPNVNYSINCTAVAAAVAPPAANSGSSVAGTSVSMPLPIRINAGGPAQRDTAGLLWEADKGFSGGKVVQNTNAPVVAPTTGGRAPNLFQTLRFSESDFNYAFDVPNGNYKVRLRFDEIYFKSPGQRVFNVAINGKPVLDHFDIIVAANGPYIPVDKEFSVSVTTGKLVIDFIKGTADNAQINAIEIVQAP